MNNISEVWDKFLAEATEVFVAKNTDYDSRFMRALIHYNGRRGYEAARTIWAWEVEKKLDRCRAWIKRGELSVKSEGVRDSVVDLFNYTVQYWIYRNQVARGTKVEAALSRDNFVTTAMLGPDYWLRYLYAIEGLLGPDEDQLRDLLREEMTGLPF